jgi:hypothetical protein
MAGNTTAGIEADAGAKVFVDNTMISGNGTGVQPGGTVALSNSDITFSSTGISGPITSFGTNRLFGALIADRRDRTHITHTVADVLRARRLAIGRGYPDGNDFEWLRRGLAFKMSCGRLPDTGTDRCSQPTISRRKTVVRVRGFAST